MAATTAATIYSSSSLLRRKIPSFAFPLRHSSPSIPANLACPSLSLDALARAGRRGRGLYVRADSGSATMTSTSSSSGLGAAVSDPPVSSPISAPRSPSASSLSPPSPRIRPVALEEPVCFEDVYQRYKR